MLQRKEWATRYGGLTEAVGAQPVVEGKSTFLLPFPHPAPGRWAALVPVLVVLFAGARVFSLHRHRYLSPSPGWPGLRACLVVFGQGNCHDHPI